MISEVFSAFYITEFDDSFHTYKKNIISSINKIKEENEGVHKSNCGGWQSENFHPKFSPQFFKDEHCSKVVTFISDTVNKHLNEIFISSISGLWINVNPPHAYNKTHIHPRSVLSGVFYVNVPEQSGELVLVNDTEKTRPRGQFFKNIKIDEEYFIKPYDGQLILFDSYQPHRVTENRSNSSRISIAFNIDISVNLNKVGENLIGSKE